MPRLIRTKTPHAGALAVLLATLAALALPAGAGAAVPGGFVGITSEETFSAAGPTRAATLADQHRAGVRLIRQTFDWSQIEYSPGAYDWTLTDHFMLAAAAKGISVLPVLFNPPPFHSSRPSVGARRGTYPPRSPADMARFAAAAVKRYGRHGTLWRQNPGAPARPITAWQVWNEPTLPVYWGGRPNARAYVKLLKAVNRAIKRQDRRAEVVTAGLPPSKLRGSVPILRFVRQLYRAGGKRAFDTLAVNSYARNTRELGTLMRQVRKTMNRRGDRKARIWITELGWCDQGPASRFCVGEARQASLTGSSIRYIRRNRKRLRLRGFVYFTWRDAPPYAPTYRDMWGLHTGLLERHGAPKPALSAFVKSTAGLR
jgi:hypothetical protein